MTLNKLISFAKEELIKNDKEETVALILIEHVFELSPSEIYLNMDQKINSDKKENFLKLLNIHIKENIPVQYIVGHQHFYGHKFVVNNNVLIPRYETEELVENILYKYDDYFGGKEIKVCDIATGSGCIGLTLAKEESHMDVTITDISSEALEIARVNAKNLEVDVKILQGDMLEPVKGMKFDILISNPPYIPTSEDVMSLVKDNEPHLALFGGDDGLKFYRIILENCAPLLNEKAMIAFEHAYDKANEIKELALENFPNAKVEILKDMQGLDRMTFVLINL